MFYTPNREEMNFRAGKTYAILFACSGVVLRLTIINQLFSFSLLAIENLILDRKRILALLKLITEITKF
jgi:hypothetical protein